MDSRSSGWSSTTSAVKRCAVAGPAPSIVPAAACKAVTSAPLVPSMVTPCPPVARPPSAAGATLRHLHAAGRPTSPAQPAVHGTAHATPFGVFWWEAAQDQVLSARNLVTPDTVPPDPPGSAGGGPGMGESYAQASRTSGDPHRDRIRNRDRSGRRRWSSGPGSLTGGHRRRLVGVVQRTSHDAERRAARRTSRVITAVAALSAVCAVVLCVAAGWGSPPWWAFPAMVVAIAVAERASVRLVVGRQAFVFALHEAFVAVGLVLAPGAWIALAYVLA